jgi:hypothetical protein
MKRIRNTTREPVRVPLGGDSVLHLGPAKEGSVAEEALERPAFRKLVEAGVIEVLGQGTPDDPDFVDGKPPRQSTHGHHHSTVIKPAGDR